MSNTIASILRAEQPRFSHDIEKLEKLSGRPGIDIKLTLKLKQSTPRAIRKLGLDPADTSAEELYEALKLRLEKDNGRIAGMVGIKDDDTAQEVIKKTSDYINKKIKLPMTWQLKGTFLRGIIRKNPPKQLMKATGYRSVASLLKREQPAEIIAIGRVLDSKWYEKIVEGYKKAKPTDIEQKPLRLLIVKQSRIDRMKKSTDINAGQILTINELGSIVILPPADRFKADVIASVVVLIEAFREIKLTSSLLKFLTVRKDFGSMVSRLVRGGSKSSDKVLPLSWSAICSFAYKNRIIPQFVQPHITQEDLDVSPTITEFCITFPELNFWYGFDSLAVLGKDGAVSCNLVDTVLNTCNNLEFENRVSDFVRRCLEDELYCEYLIFPDAQRELLQFKDESDES